MKKWQDEQIILGKKTRIVFISFSFWTIMSFFHEFKWDSMMRMGPTLNPPWLVVTSYPVTRLPCPFSSPLSKPIHKKWSLNEISEVRVDGVWSILKLPRTLCNMCTLCVYIYINILDVDSLIYLQYLLICFSPKGFSSTSSFEASMVIKFLFISHFLTKHPFWVVESGEKLTKKTPLNFTP